MASISIELGFTLGLNIGEFTLGLGLDIGFGQLILATYFNFKSKQNEWLQDNSNATSRCVWLARVC